MRQSTILDYNAKDRAVEWCIDIYFDGLNMPPLHCTRANHLIDCDLLEEACADSDSFIGVPSSNEVSFQLFGSRSTFNPTDRNSPYYGKIKAGVPVRIFCRPIQIADPSDEFNWDPLGTFYITEWISDLTGVTADVVACDVLYNLFNDEQTVMNIVPNYTYQDLVTDFFMLNGYTPTIVGDLTEVLSFAYISDTNAKFISDFSIGALAFVFCNHAGNIIIQDIDRPAIPEYTLTDNDQVISVSSKQSAILDYNGVSLKYNKLQVSDELMLLSNKRQGIGASSTLAFSTQSFSETPVYAISHASIKSEANCFVDDVELNPYSVSYVVANASDMPAYFDLTLYGHVIEKLQTTISDGMSKELALESTYIQNEEYAQHIVNLLHKYISLPVPILELEVRGNPLIAIGSVVTVHSAMYNIDFTGILIRQKFKYDGGMSATMSILSTEIVGA